MELIFKVKINGDFNVSISTSGTKQRAYINKIVVMSNTNSEENILIENITDTCYEFTNLDNQHTYVYQVRCVTDEGTSKWSKYSQKIEFLRLLISDPVIGKIFLSEKIDNLKFIITIFQAFINTTSSAIFSRSPVMCDESNIVLVSSITNSLNI